MEIAGLGCRPDILGFRHSKHERLPEPDERGVVTVVPDWICEVLSPSTAYLDPVPNITTARKTWTIQMARFMACSDPRTVRWPGRTLAQGSQVVESRR
jgi:hypothetical protein